MNPAKLNKRITFQDKKSYQDDEGNWVEGTWVDAFTVWGSIEGVGSMRNPEATIAGALGVKSPRKIIIRANRGLKHEMRATCDGRFFDVLDFGFIRNSKAYYEIMCNEVGING